MNTSLITSSHKEHVSGEQTESLIKLLKQGYIFYMKNGIMQKVKAPKYGDVTIQYRDDAPYLVTVKTSKLI